MAVRKTVFTESDAYQWKQHDGLIPFMPLEEYAKLLAPIFHFKRENGILEGRLHTNGKEFMWGTFPHKALHQFYTWVGQDHNNEVLIWGGSGKNFFGGIFGDSEQKQEGAEGQGFDPEEGESHDDNNWTLYEHQYYDGTNEIEGQVFDIEIPTIGVWNGGAFHSDLFLFNDITLATEDAWTTEMHFRINMAPGDGVQIAWRNLMGRKRYAYAELTGQVITARKAMEYGMINEIVTDVDAAFVRAWEIAELIMHSGTRQTRRLTTQIIRMPLKEQVAKELRGSFATEMWNTITEASPHHPDYWETAKAQARATLPAEAKGKIVQPCIGPFIADDVL